MLRFSRRKGGRAGVDHGFPQDHPGVDIWTPTATDTFDYKTIEGHTTGNSSEKSVVESSDKVLLSDEAPLAPARTRSPK